MICEQFNCLFVHIPKAAGQSIEHFFLNLCGLDWHQRGRLLLRPNNDAAQGPERLAHLTATEYVACGHLSPWKFAALFKFSFVRNPWERLVSEYFYRGHNKRFPFREYVLHRLPPPGLSDAYRHVMPQYEFLHDSRGRLLVDFVGRFETLQSDFDTVCKTLGIESSGLPHINSSARRGTLKSSLKSRLMSLLPDRQVRHGSYARYYDEDTNRAVIERYGRDIEAFGYDGPGVD